ncbi:MAG: cation transporter [Eggerthellaceae bacterium]|nr:cation transporter [Eggerthellaceae bacterium]
MTEKTLKVTGMHCEHCVANVKAALEAVPGVRNVQVSLEEGKATLEAGVVASDEKLVAAVEGAGCGAEACAVSK